MHGSIFFGSAAGVLSDIIDACNISIKLPLGASYGSMSNLSRADGGSKSSLPISSEVTPLMSSSPQNGVSMGSPISFGDLEKGSGSIGSGLSGEKNNYLRFLVLDCRNMKVLSFYINSASFQLIIEFTINRGLMLQLRGAASVSCTDSLRNKASVLCMLVSSILVMSAINLNILISVSCRLC